MLNPPPLIRRSLLPLSWLYGIAVEARNFLFDVKILKSNKFDIPVICLGNITVGGTGKTPHIEYVVKLLSSKYKVAILSRGYKRKSKGFLIVDTDSKAQHVGDEPLQMKQKFPDTLVVVDSNRCKAIEKILSIEPEERPDIILMDDGFQHRFVSPSLSVLLVDSNRPVFEDTLLPAGNLREPLKGKNRANMVIVTKCSRDMQPIDFRIYENGLNLFPHQQLYFTTFDYGNLSPVFANQNLREIEPDDLRKKHVFLVTGIASPQPLVEKLELKTYNLYTKFYPDHHFFKESDIEDIKKELDEIDDDDKIIVTTEKDAVRFRELTFLDEDLKQRMYYIPIEVIFLDKSEKESFNKKINNHVRNYQTNSRLSKR